MVSERARERDDSLAMLTRYHYPLMYVLIVLRVAHFLPLRQVSQFFCMEMKHDKQKTRVAGWVLCSHPPFFGWCFGIWALRIVKRQRCFGFFFSRSYKNSIIEHMPISIEIVWRAHDTAVPLFTYGWGHIERFVAKESIMKACRQRLPREKCNGDRSWFLPASLR